MTGGANESIVGAVVPGGGWPEYKNVNIEYDSHDPTARISMLEIR